MFSRTCRMAYPAALRFSRPFFTRAVSTKWQTRYETKVDKLEKTLEELVAVERKAKEELVAAKDELVGAKDEVVAAKNETMATKEKLAETTQKLQRATLKEQKLALRFILETIADNHRLVLRESGQEKSRLSTTEALKLFATSQAFLDEIKRAVSTEERQKGVRSAFQMMMSFASMHHHQFLQELLKPDPDGVFHTKEQEIAFACACRAAKLGFDERMLMA